MVVFLEVLRIMVAFEDRDYVIGIIQHNACPL